MRPSVPFLLSVILLVTACVTVEPGSPLPGSPLNVDRAVQQLEQGTSGFTGPVQPLSGSLTIAVPAATVEVDGVMHTGNRRGGDDRTFGGRREVSLSVAPDEDNRRWEISINSEQMGTASRGGGKAQPLFTGHFESGKQGVEALGYEFPGRTDSSSRPGANPLLKNMGDFQAMFMMTSLDDLVIHPPSPELQSGDMIDLGFSPLVDYRYAKATIVGTTQCGRHDCLVGEVSGDFSNTRDNLTETARSRGYILIDRETFILREARIVQWSGASTDSNPPSQNIGVLHIDFLER